MKKHPAQKWHWDKMGEIVSAALIKNNFEAVYIPTIEKARDYVISRIPEKTTIGVGGSVTIRELKLIDTLEKRGQTVFHHWRAELGHSEDGGRVDGFIKGSDFDIRRKAMMSDVYLCSSNVVTMDGKLVNMDGFGNRVAAMIFGPRKTIIVVSICKVVKDVAAGIERIETLTAPTSAYRGRADVPCVVTGVCSDCNSPDRCCSVMSIMHKKPKGAEILVVLVGEEMGF